MAFRAYILRSFHTGHTDNLDRHIGMHQTPGFCGFAVWRMPAAPWNEAESKP